MHFSRTASPMYISQENSIALGVATRGNGGPGSGVPWEWRPQGVATLDQSTLDRIASVKAG